jgi:hypothetical protein
MNAQLCVHSDAPYVPHVIGKGARSDVEVVIPSTGGRNPALAEAITSAEQYACRALFFIIRRTLARPPGGLPAAGHCFAAASVTHTSWDIVVRCQCQPITRRRGAIARSEFDYAHGVRYRRR